MSRLRMTLTRTRRRKATLATSARPLGAALGCAALMAGAVATVTVQSSPGLARSELWTTGKAEVVEGHTLNLNGFRVRLQGIDAPGIKQQCIRRGAAYACGAESAEVLRALVTGKEIQCRLDAMDQYGRDLVTCFIGEIDVNQYMVEKGHAVAYRGYLPAYEAAEERARLGKHGMWAGQFERPDEWRRLQREARARGQPARCARCLIKGNIDWKGRRIYYYPWDAGYCWTVINQSAGERWFFSEGEANQAGWTPAEMYR